VCVESDCMYNVVSVISEIDLFLQQTARFMYTGYEQLLQQWLVHADQYMWFILKLVFLDLD
jgi:hypothetical protein